MQSILVIVSVVSLFSLLCSGDGASAFPGKVAVWDASSGSNIQYVTKTSHSQHVVDHVKLLPKKYETVVLFSAGGSAADAELLASPPIVQSVRNSGSIVWTNVYQKDSGSVKNDILRSVDLNKAKTVSAIELKELISTGKALHYTFHVKVDLNNAAEQNAMNDLFATTRSYSQGEVLFIAVDEPSADAVAPTQAGDYQRLLKQHSPKIVTTATTSASAPATGAEFSIYYEGTYLYITPDIFTGLMTMLFMFTVALVGLNCMGSIQGMSSFYDRVPSNGKEA